jgi:hypothetical protein
MEDLGLPGYQHVRPVDQPTLGCPVSERQQRIWLNGDRYNEAYLYETSTGRARRFRTEGGSVEQRATATPLRGKFVAVYVEPDGTSITVQVGCTRYPLDGRTHATAKVHAAGLYSTVTIAREGHRSIRLTQRTIARWILRRFNPAYDDLDEMMDDFTSGIAGLVSSEEAQASYMNVKDPAAGPWDILDQQS